MNVLELHDSDPKVTERVTSKKAINDLLVWPR